MPGADELLKLDQSENGEKEAPRLGWPMKSFFCLFSGLCGCFKGLVEGFEGGALCFLLFLYGFEWFYLGCLCSDFCCWKGSASVFKFN